MRENAAYPPDRFHIFLAYPAEDRIFHKRSHLIFARGSGSLYTSENQPFHIPHMLEERAGQVSPKEIGKVCMTSLSNLPLSKIKRQEECILAFQRLISQKRAKSTGYLEPCGSHQNNHNGWKS